jgi:hypothetical protein
MTPSLGFLSRYAAGRAALLLLLPACSPRATPPPPDPETREIEERTPRNDRDRVGPLGIPEAQLPAPGQCRLWHPDRPSAQQPPAAPCAEAEDDVPAGSWILYRPPDDKRVVHVRVFDPKRQGVLLRIDLYDVQKGTYLGTKQP